MRLAIALTIIAVFVAVTLALKAVGYLHYEDDGQGPHE